MPDFPTIDPNIPSSSFLPPPGSATPPPTTVGDNQSAYSADIAAGDSLTIVGFSGAILSATNNLQETTWAVQQSNANSRDEMYFAAMQETLAIIVLYDKISTQANTYSSIYKQNQNSIDTINSDVQSYNNGIGEDESQVATLNNAITQFDNNQISQSQLQTAINNYNAYKATRGIADQTNTDIGNYNNTQVPTNNQTIQNLIQQLTSEGVSQTTLNELTQESTYTGGTAVPLPSVPDAPNSPPYPLSTITFNPQSLGQATNTMNSKAQKDATQIISDLFAPWFALLDGQFSVTAQLLKNQSNYTGFIQFFLNNVPYLPASLYQPAPNAQVGAAGAGGATGTAGSGSSVSLATMIISLSSPLMEGIISQGKFTAAYGQSLQPSLNALINKLTSLGLTILSQTGLQAGTQAANVLAGLSSVPSESPALNAVLGANVAQGSVEAVSSGAILSGVQAILANTFPNLDQATLNQLATQLAAVLQTVVLQAGLAQLAQALNAPTLTSQVLSSISTPPTSPTAQDIVKQDVARQDIINQTANATSISSDILNQAINNAVVNGQYDEQEAVNTLIQNGIDQDKAANAASIMQSYLNSEITGSSILNQSVASNRLNNSLLANQFVSNLVNTQPDITNRELRDQLIQESVNNGATQQEAISTATTLVTGQSPIPTVPQSIPDTVKNLGLAQIAGLGLSPSESVGFANSLVNTVNSIVSLFQSNLNTLIKGQDAKTAVTINDNFQATLASTNQLAVFGDQFRSHTKTFVNLMNNNQQASNFKKGIDIAV
jgi:hypothetical protein